jgi:hypothetical protein
MPDQLSSADADLLAEMKREWTEYRWFYSNKGKEERERWVVGEFLTRLAIPFGSNELHSPPQHSRVDVEFRDARFQVKEITSPNFRRNDEINDTHLRVMGAKTLADTIGPGFAYDVPPVVSSYDLVRDNARELALSEKYIDCKENLDLVFYVTRTRASIIQVHDINPEELSSFGWRSVSYLMGKHALVLCAAVDAPSFLCASR